MVYLLEDDAPRYIGGPVLPSGPPSAGGGPPNAPNAPGGPDLPPRQGLGGPYYSPGSGDVAGGLSGILRNRLPLESADPAFNNELKARIRGVMSGRDVPFTPEVIGKLKANALAAARGQTAANVAAADRDSLRRGIFRSSVGADQAAAAETAAAQAFTSATADIDANAALANYNARMQGLSRAREWLDSLSKEMMGRAGLNLGADQITSELTLAYQRLASQERMQANDLLGMMERLLMGAGLET